VNIRVEGRGLGAHGRGEAPRLVEEPHAELVQPAELGGRTARVGREGLLDSDRLDVRKSAKVQRKPRIPFDCGARGRGVVAIDRESAVCAVRR